MDLNYRGFFWFNVILFILVLIMIASAIFLITRYSLKSTAQESLTIKDIRVDVIVAESPKDRARGLSGRTFLNEFQGMLFKTKTPESQIFWMKGMLIPIDIIWARSGVVVGAEVNVPPPEPNAPDIDLPQYPSPLPVDTVVEVSSGFVGRHHISPGDKVIITSS